MKKLFQFLSLFTCLTFGSFAQIKIDTVTITAVHDGDSYRVLYKNGVRQWVRLAYVDCPEVISNHVSAKQFYGDSAGNVVRTHIKGRMMRMVTFKKDQYKRPVVKLNAIGDNDFDLSGFIIGHGHGWYIATKGIPRKYRLKNGRKMQAYAKMKRWGLWQELNPIKPAVWRKTHRF